ncbi:hypothetical protein HOP50_14g73660 [Chloropicon primus]|nr:hypothetical protein HOP50_14g73660 [Chloropicon primus]
MACYGVTNIALSFVNKDLAQSGEVEIPPLLLAQCVATVVLMKLMAPAAKGEPRALRAFSQRMLIASPAALLYAVQHYTRMKTFVLAAVDVVLVARQLVPILCFAIERATGTEDKPQTTKSLACMGCIIAGVAVYARGKAEASDRGTSEAATTFAWTLALHLASTSVANVYTKHVCQRMHASQYTLAVNLVSIPIFLYSSRRHLVPAPGFGSLGGRAKGLAALSVVLSVGISLAASMTQKRIDSASFAVFSNVLKIATIVLSSVLDKDTSVTATSWVGIGAAFAGSYFYSKFRQDPNNAPTGRKAKSRTS